MCDFQESEQCIRVFFCVLLLWDCYVGFIDCIGRPMLTDLTLNVQRQFHQIIQINIKEEKKKIEKRHVYAVESPLLFYYVNLIKQLFVGIFNRHFLTIA